MVMVMVVVVVVVMVVLVDVDMWWRRWWWCMGSVEAADRLAKIRDDEAEAAGRGSLHGDPACPVVAAAAAAAVVLVAVLMWWWWWCVWSIPVVAVEGEEQVVGFEVPVYDALLFQVVHATQQLQEEIPHHTLRRKRVRVSFS